MNILTTISFTKQVRPVSIVIGQYCSLLG